jgi:hypothetical protein
MNNNAGKGSTPRPFSVDRKTFSSNWDNTFQQPTGKTCMYSGLPHVENYITLEDKKKI